MVVVVLVIPVALPVIVTHTHARCGSEVAFANLSPPLPPHFKYELHITSLFIETTKKVFATDSDLPTVG